MSSQPVNLEAWDEFLEGKSHVSSDTEEEEKVLLDIDRGTGRLVATLPGENKKYRVAMMFSDEELESFCEELDNVEHGRKRYSDGGRS